MFGLTKKKPDATATYEVLEGFVGKHGSYPGGALVAGDDPAVAAQPHLFILAGSTDADRATARASLLRAGLPEADAGYQPMVGSTKFQLPRKLTPDEAVVATAAVFPYGSRQAHLGYVAAGSVLAKTDEIAKRWPQSFRPATAADIPA